MLRRRFGLSRPVAKWASQAVASLGATLAATAIWSALPHPAPEVRPDMTSGGKYAARAVEAVAYDGLDTMPLPHAGAALADGTIGLRPAAFLQRASLETVLPAAPAPERPARSARRTASRGEARSPTRAEAAPHPTPVIETAAPVAEVRDEPGALSSLGSAFAATARAAWRTTADAGDALVARVVPQMP